MGSVPAGRLPAPLLSENPLVLPIKQYDELTKSYWQRMSGAFALLLPEMTQFR